MLEGEGGFGVLLDGFGHVGRMDDFLHHIFLLTGGGESEDDGGNESGEKGRRDSDREC